MSERKSWLVILGVLGILPACVSSEPMPSTASTPDQTTPVEASPLPEPVAQLKQDNGNTISFYDLDGNVLITGEGPAGNPPAFPADVDLAKMKVIDAWTQLSGGQAAPQRLVDFQHKLEVAPPPPAELRVIKQPSSNPVDTGLSVDNVPLNNPEGTLASPTGCNNGCCDQDWLLTFVECANVGYDWRWFDFNYLYSQTSAGNIFVVRSMTCAATGTSTWTFTINGKGWTTPVLEAHYLETSWQMGGIPPFYATGSMVSNVNSVGNQHLYTTCGNLLHFY